MSYIALGFEGVHETPRCDKIGSLGNTSVYFFRLYFIAAVPYTHSPGELKQRFHEIDALNAK